MHVGQEGLPVSRLLFVGRWPFGFHASVCAEQMLLTFVDNHGTLRPGSRTLRCLSNKLKGHALTTRNAQDFWFFVLRSSHFITDCKASRAKESDVLSLLQRHAALMRHEPGRKYMKSEHADHARKIFQVFAGHASCHLE